MVVSFVSNGGIFANLNKRYPALLFFFVLFCFRLFIINSFLIQFFFYLFMHVSILTPLMVHDCAKHNYTIFLSPSCAIKKMQFRLRVNLKHIVLIRLLSSRYFMFSDLFQGDIFVKECKLKPHILMGIYTITTRTFLCEIILL